MAAGQKALRGALSASSRLNYAPFNRYIWSVPSLVAPLSLTSRQSTSTLGLLRSQRGLFPALTAKHPYSTTLRDPHPLTDNDKTTTSDADAEALQARRDQEPAYLIYFTCKPCSHRSSHRITKHGYHKGTVLITCPSCSNRHVISDHLKIFMDAPVTVEDLLAKKGLKVTKGTMEGDMEWWDKDGTESPANSDSTTRPELAQPNSGKNQEGQS